MTLEVERGMTKGISVPYGPIFDGVRVNRGFTDTRGKPDVAAKIAEGQSSDELKRLLIEISREGRLFSIGCDLDSHVENERKASERYVAGGYLQVAFMEYFKTPTSAYDALTVEIERAVRSMSDKSNWCLRLLGCYVDFTFLNEQRGRAPTLWIWFYARTGRVASASRKGKAHRCVGIRPRQDGSLEATLNLRRHPSG